MLYHGILYFTRVNSIFKYIILEIYPILFSSRKTMTEYEEPDLGNLSSLLTDQLNCPGFQFL
jgi:hypothetical protein